MNQTQREFLIKHIERRYTETVREIKERKPVKPSLNNYLVAAVLDGSFQLQEVEVLRAFIREAVLALGPQVNSYGRGARGMKARVKM